MAAPVTLLPRTPHRSTREAAAASQRDRMLVAMAEVAADKGYGEATVSDVIAAAGVSRKTFYQHFDDKQTCFLAAYDFGVEAMAAGVGQRALADDAGWRDRLAAVLTTYLELLAGEPAFARIALVEIWCAGKPGLARYSATIDRFHGVLAALSQQARQEDPGLPALSPLALEALAGAVNRVATARVLDRRAAELPALADELTAFAASVIEGGA